MSRDVDVLRRLLLELEKEQRSPPEPIFVPLDDFARTLDKSTDEVGEALDLLLGLEFIDGPGAYKDAWLFRKLTRRGVQLLDAIRDTDEWSKVKDAYNVFLEP
ncbi:DUF2513 domain-containing protein [Methylocystis sp. ATCC 49242]|uniref:DUF2513 domain-containing protein n=1 Tax=Methylocystis sp. ATCC 49242 TaxID=622637 RepID=UPI0001F885D1|nr:DUF2513 domain-containing protein [Methylocystis sp. ATCC 49242]